MKSVSFNSKNNTFNCLSVIISAYNEQDNIIPLYQKLKKNLDNLQKKRFFTQYEVLFINDGSTDQTEAKIKTICSKNQNVKKISLRKNFGKSTALQAGFFHANGDIITLDADMQDDPDEICQFIKKINEEYDIVSGWKKKQTGSFGKKNNVQNFQFYYTKNFRHFLT